jgi:polar amino acid transport system substrate-binding protein
MMFILIKRMVLLSMLAVCMACSLQSNALSTEKMVIVYFDDYRPFSWKDDKGQMQGILPDILTEVIQKRMGISLEHRGYPWARSQDMVRSGEADAFCTVPTDERRQYANVSSEAVLQNQVTIYTW